MTWDWVIGGVRMKTDRVRGGLLAIAVMTTLLAGPAQAGSKSAGTLYAGGSLALLGQSLGGVEGSFDTTALIGRAGYFPIDMVAVEARLGFGASDDSVTRIDINDASKTDVGLGYLAGIYAVAHVPVPIFSPYLVAGFSSVDIDSTVTRMDETLSRSRSRVGFGYGAGLDFSFLPLVSLSVEYMDYVDSGPVATDALSLGLKVSF